MLLRPKISIITPSHKLPENWEFTMKSVFAQTFEDWEWVILDSSEGKQLTKNIGSTPKRQIVYKHVLYKSNYRVKVFQALNELNKNKIGLIKYINCNLAGYTSELIVELDHDDYLMSDALEKVWNVFQNNPEVGFVYSDYVPLNENVSRTNQYFSSLNCTYETTINNPKYGIMKVNVFRTPEITKNHLNSNIFPCHLRAWRISTYKKVGGHDINLNISDDYDLVIKTMLNTTSCQIKEPLYIWNFGNNDTTTFQYDENFLVSTRYRILRKYYEELENLKIKVINT